MKKISILAIAILSVSLGGCLVNPFYGPPIYGGPAQTIPPKPLPSPVVKQNEALRQAQGRAFFDLVKFLRDNAKVEKPSPDLKAKLAVYLKNAGLTYQCFDKEGCYFLRGTQRIRIDNKYVFIYAGDNKSFMKVERTDVAVNIIY